MTVTITLTVAGADTGPFNLYSDVDGYVSPFETGVLKTALTSGYTSSLVPDGTTIIKILSTGICTNFVYVDVVPITTTSTSTTASPTTTTTTSAPQTQLFFNYLGATDEAVMGINNNLGQSFYISFTYTVSATVNNNLTPASANSAVTAIKLSTNGGSSWWTEKSVTAVANAGYANSDTQTDTGIFSIGGITNVTNVRVLIEIDCGTDSVGTQSGSGSVYIGSVLPDSGSAVAICNDRYAVQCIDGVATATLYC